MSEPREGSDMICPLSHRNCDMGCHSQMSCYSLCFHPPVANAVVEPDINKSFEERLRQLEDNGRGSSKPTCDC